jgi:CheY-like chemotaxis protein
MLKRIRVLLADDHQMLSDALKGVLEPKFEVVGSVRDGRALVEAAARLKPEVVVVDVAMPRLNGLDAARQIKHTMPQVKLIFMTMNEDPDLVGGISSGRVGISVETGSGVRVDDRNRQSRKRRFVCDAERRGGPGEHRVARAASPATYRGADTTPTGSDPTVGGGAFHERSGFRFEHHETDRCGA